jgi:Integrase zinc binding domain
MTVKKENGVPCVIVKHFEEGFEPIDCEELINEKSFDAYCQSILQRMEQTESEFSIDDRGLIVRLDPNAYRTQIYIPESLGEHRMSLGHYPQIAGHPGGTRMYQNVRIEEFGPRMAIEIHQFLQNCASCAITRLLTQRKANIFETLPTVSSFGIRCKGCSGASSENENQLSY